MDYSRNRMVGTLRPHGIGGPPEHIVCKPVEEFRGRTVGRSIHSTFRRTV